MSIAYKISAFNRKRKWKLFNTLYNPSPETKILDAGFGEYENSPVDNFLEKHYPYPHKITALGISEPREFSRRYPAVTAVRYNGGRFPFEDKSFDICWSNAVLEHVGSREQQLYFLKETARVAKSAFITTPNRYFPVEVHTKIPLLHYLPKRHFDSLMSLAGKKWAEGDSINLLSFGEIKKLLKDAGISEYKIISNRLFLFTLDFIICFSYSG
ncbi:MAG: class I SAM-dependent methyltransferase [Candidatus Omnitrophica bacterium]|nr:class I SAM-dependent methyltransferase [Candidatus Omnitrophota bacterium]